jgi:hypothetical protein
MKMMKNKRIVKWRGEKWRGGNGGGKIENVPRSLARSRVCGAHTHQRVSVAGAGERSAAHAMLRIGRTSASLLARISVRAAAALRTCVAARTWLCIRAAQRIA